MRTTTSLVITAVVIELSLLLIHTAQTDATQIALILLAYVTGGAAFAGLLLTREKAVDSRLSGQALAIVFGAAIIFRLTLLPLGPATSSDVFRYRWEGIVQTEGFDPYTTPPSDPSLAHVAEKHGHIHAMINHPSVPSIYPPVAQFLFWLNAAVFGGTLLGWKLILLLFDMLLAVAGWNLLGAWRLPRWSLCFVLWCPLLLLETYEGCHLDLIGASLIVVALLANQRARPVLAGIALGLAFNVKYLWPALALVLLLVRPEGRRGRITTAVTTIVVAAICWIPYLPGLAAALTTARMFAESWRFNGTVFDLFRMLPGPPWLPAMLVMITLVSLAVLLARRPAGGLWPDIWLVFGAAFLLSPVAYPWYFLWLMPGLLARPPRWMIVWITVVPLLHLVAWHYSITGEWEPMRWLWILVGFAPTVLLILAWWQRLVRAEVRIAAPVPRGPGDPGGRGSSVR